MSKSKNKTEILEKEEIVLEESEMDKSATVLQETETKEIKSKDSQLEKDEKEFKRENKIKKKIIKKGIVINCGALRIRANPNINGKQTGLLKNNEIVRVIINDSTENFYAIKTGSDGIGFCMKSFIDLI